MRFATKTLTALLLVLALLAPSSAATVTITGSGALDTKSVSGVSNSPIAVVFGSFAFDSSYPTGGEAFDLTTYLGRGILIVSMPAKSGYVFVYDATNKKMLAYISDDAVDPLDQVANTTDLSALTSVPFVAFGFTY